VIGVSGEAARADHKHDITTAAAVSITSATNAEGSATTLARSDHTHAHGNLSGGSLHADVIAAGASGFMTGADKTKLDGIAPGATATPLSATPPVDVTKTAAAVGVSTDAARADHKHDITTAAAVSITSATNAEGTATTLARSDHTHAHGSLSGGSLHADVIASGASGFMTGADKTKLDGIASGATNTPLASSAPVDVTKAAAAVGVSTTAARADHKHDISTATVVAITDSTNAEGTATSLARSDHTHSHGNRGGGSLHANVVAGGASGFMTGADKTKLDALPSSQSSLVLFGADSEAATTVTRYLYPAYGTAVANTTAIPFAAPRAGTLRNMRVIHGTPAGNGLSIVYTVRINSVASTLTVSMASTASSGSDLVHTVAVAAGDLIDLEVTKAASVGTSPGSIVVSMEYV
jgi:acyl-coenzyme A thioesterase PaaI-like protein